MVTIGNELAANALGPNQVPNPTVSVDDVDQGPSIAREVVEDGCGDIVVRDKATAMSVMHGVNTWSLRRLISIFRVLRMERWCSDSVHMEVVGRAACADDISAKLSRNGTASDYPEGQVINQPGDV